MSALLERMREHDDNNEDKWLWSGRGDRRRIIAGWTWYSFVLGIEWSRDWKTSYIALNLGPLSLAFVWDH